MAEYISNGAWISSRFALSNPVQLQTINRRLHEARTETDNLQATHKQTCYAGHLQNSRLCIRSPWAGGRKRRTLSHTCQAKNLCHTASIFHGYTYKYQVPGKRPFCTEDSTYSSTSHERTHTTIQHPTICNYASLAKTAGTAQEQTRKLSHGKPNVKAQNKTWK